MKTLFFVMMGLLFCIASAQTDPFAAPSSRTADPFASDADVTSLSSFVPPPPKGWTEPPPLLIGETPSPQTFHVGKVGQQGANETREKLLDVFAQIQRCYFYNGKAIVLKPSIIQCTAIFGTISQALNRREFLFHDFYLKTAEDCNWVDGDYVFILATPATPYSFHSVGSGLRTVRGFAEAGSEPGPTQQQFLDALHAGKKFIAHVIEKRIKAPTNKINLGPDPKVDTDIKYTVEW